MLYEQGQSFIGVELGLGENYFDRNQPQTKDHYNAI